MLRELGRADGRIDRRRHGAGVERAEKSQEEFQTGRQHDGDSIPGLDAALAQTAGDRTRPPRQCLIAESDVLAIALGQNDICAIAMLADVPIQHFGQYRRLPRRGLGLRPRNRFEPG